MKAKISKKQKQLLFSYYQKNIYLLCTSRNEKDNKMTLRSCSGA